MPIRGIVLIFLIVITVCIIMKDEIYVEIKKLFENDTNKKGENE